MGRCIDARKRDDEIKFRIWTTVSDQYLTRSLTREELKDWLLEERLWNAFEESERNDPIDIEMASKKGTTSRFANRQDTSLLESKWRKQMKHPPFKVSEEERKEYKEKLRRYKAILQKIITDLEKEDI